MISSNRRTLLVAVLIVVGLPLASCDSGGGSDPVQVPSAWSGSWELAGYGVPEDRIVPPDNPEWHTLEGDEWRVLDGEDCELFSHRILEISGNTMRVKLPEDEPRETLKFRVDEVTADSLFMTEITDGPEGTRMRLGEEPNDPREVAPGCP